MANITNNNYTFKQSSPTITWEMDGSYKSKDFCELSIQFKSAYTLRLIHMLLGKLKFDYGNIDTGVGTIK